MTYILGSSRAKVCLALLLSILMPSYTLAMMQPEPLAFNGKTVTPYCFFHLLQNKSGKKVFSLLKDKCMQYHAHYNTPALKRNLIGYDLPEKLGGGGVYYRYIGHITETGKTQYVVLVFWSGGGSGLFSELLLLQKEKEWLIVSRVISGGDRCSGGLSDASIKKNNLSYSKKITPWMLMTVPTYQDSNAKGLNQLADCAVCCIGELHYKKHQLLGFQFSGEKAFYDGKNKLMRCFNKIAEKWGGNKKVFLNTSKVNAFQEAVRSNCKIF
jgi:hypothetical protein